MDAAIIYITGVSGSGKTTIGQMLSAKTGIPFFDADDFHSAVNKAKMKAGISLNDADRQDWLLQLNQLALLQAKTAGAIIACSALRQVYRTALSQGIANPAWIFLQGTYELLRERMIGRHGHYMPVQLLTSQLQTLQVPQYAFTVNIALPPEEIVNRILKYIQQSAALTTQ